MSSVKERVEAVVKKMPKNCTMDEVIYELYFADRIERGLEAMREGRTISQDQLKREIKKWKSAR